MSKEQAWIDALKKLECDPAEKVSCPDCKEGTLEIRDVAIPSWKKVDRYLICNRCGSYNVATISSKE
jgi:hypothetical protein